MAMKSIEQMLQTPYWIIDVLPERVPSNSPGQVFSVERFFLQRQLSDIKQKHINIILKLNGYLESVRDVKWIVYMEFQDAPGHFWNYSTRWTLQSPGCLRSIGI